MYRKQLVEKIITKWNSIEEGADEKMFVDSNGRHYYFNKDGKKIYPWNPKKPQVTT